MSTKQIIQEAINKDPIALKQLIGEALKERLGAALKEAAGAKKLNENIEDEQSEANHEYSKHIAHVEDPKVRKGFMKEFSKHLGNFNDSYEQGEDGSDGEEDALDAMHDVVGRIKAHTGVKTGGTYYDHIDEHGSDEQREKLYDIHDNVQDAAGFENDEDLGKHINKLKALHAEVMKGK